MYFLWNHLHTDTEKTSLTRDPLVSNKSLKVSQKILPNPASLSIQWISTEFLDPTLLYNTSTVSLTVSLYVHPGINFKPIYTSNQNAQNN